MWVQGVLILLEEKSQMKNKRIVKTIELGIGGMLMLLIGISSILLPLGINTVQAASVQIKDDARVLDVDQVHNTASKLSHPVSISTVRTFNGPKSDFVRSMEQALLTRMLLLSVSALSSATWRLLLGNK